MDQNFEEDSLEAGAMCRNSGKKLESELNFSQDAAANVAKPTALQGVAVIIVLFQLANPLNNIYGNS